MFVLLVVITGGGDDSLKDCSELRSVAIRVAWGFRFDPLRYSFDTSCCDAFRYGSTVLLSCMDAPMNVLSRKKS